MADFSLGSHGTGRLEAWVNWNSSSQAEFHYKLSVETRGGYYDTTGNATWNGHINNGHVGSGSWSYTSNGWRTLREFDVVINKDANGYLTVPVYGYINGNNGGAVGAGSASFNVGTTRIGLAPEGRNKSVDTITPTSARFGAYHSNHGRGTSSNKRTYYRLNDTGTYSNTAEMGATGWHYATVTLAKNSMYGYFTRHWNNNGDTADTATSTFVTLADATETSKEVLATSVNFVLAAAQGYRTTTTKVQYRKTGDTTWLDSATDTTATPAITISGLLPNTEYEYRYAVTTTDGTWTGATQTLTTLPAGKLIYPNGDVLNAIPRVVYPNGDVTMLNINLVD